VEREKGNVKRTLNKRGKMMMYGAAWFEAGEKR